MTATRRCLRHDGARREPIQLTVIGGFLGAGKTTLLNRLLRDAGDRRLAVLVNDFGAINIDAELVQSREGEIVSLKNGCICCGVAGDFIGELALLRDRPDPPAHVVVEASGVADPGQIVVLGDLPGYRKDAAVVVTDAETVRARAADAATGYLVRAQLRAADLLVLNKTDLVDGEQLAQTRAWLREITGPSTAIVEASFGQVPIDVVLGARTFARPEREPHDHETRQTTTIRASRPGAGRAKRRSTAPASSRRSRSCPPASCARRGCCTCVRIPPAATCCRSSDGASACCPTVRGETTRPDRSSSSSDCPGPSTSGGWRRSSSA